MRGMTGINSKLVCMISVMACGWVIGGCSSEDNSGDGESANTIKDRDLSDGHDGADSDFPTAPWVAGTWQGEGWSDVGTEAGGVISAVPATHTFGEEPLCVEGDLIADYSSLGVVGMNVNQTNVGLPSEDISPWYAGDDYDGVFVDLTNNASTAIRIELMGEDDNSYCALLSSGARLVKWNAFATECWGTDGIAYDTSVGIEAVQIYAAGEVDGAVPFGFCINDLFPGTVQVDTDSGNDTGGEFSGKFVGNITTGDNSSVDWEGMVFSRHWDQITPENAGKWGSVRPDAESTYENWSALDAIYAYTQDNNIIFKQHAFLWGSQEPEHASQLQEADVKKWMSDFCSRYPNTALIDVVNEPPPHTTPSYVANISDGGTSEWQWIINSFEWADEACPDAILILNDYNNIEWPVDNQHFIDIANAVIDAGAPIDAVGAQSHDLDHQKVSTATMKSLLEKLHADTGLPVYITEYDISFSNEDDQLSKYEEQIPYFLETEWIKGITIWGWIYGKTWTQAPNSGLVENGSPRKAMTWLMNTLGRPIP